MDPAGLEPATTRVLSDGTLICASSCAGGAGGSRTLIAAMPLRCSAAELQPQSELVVLVVPSPGTAPGSPGFQAGAFLIKLRRRMAAPTGLEPVISSRNRPASIPTRTTKSLAERVGIEPIVLDRQSSGSPAADHAPWCCDAAVLLSGVPLQDRTGTSGVTDRRAGHYTRGTVDWWEGETASGHRPS